MEKAISSQALENMREEVKQELLTDIIPFWKSLRDKEYGGYFGWMSYDLVIDKQAEKGCILNSRIMWFFSNAYTMLKNGKITEEECKAYGFSGKELLDEARHGYEFLKKKCLDEEYGGVYWSLNYDGTPIDTTKHTYNQAFSIYALASYYEASKDEEAIKLAKELYYLIEKKCTDKVGYLEAFTREFLPESNEKLSENGVLADKTMNTLLHVFEAYTEFYRVTGDKEVKERLIWIMNLFADKIYNEKLNRQEVFFDTNYNSILDLHSYGHDIETAWLIDRGVEVIDEKEYELKMYPITKRLTENIYKIAFNGQSLANECEKGIVNANRVWWVQAENLVGLLNGYEKNPECFEYCEAALAQWQFIKDNLIDKRKGSEWYWEVNPDGTAIKGRPIVEPWKCPYHNGRMCIEVIRRI